MLYITRDHSTCTGHRVVGQGGHCENLHGHQYLFRLSCIADELDDVGRILDFGEVKKLLCSWLDNNWDHRMLIWEEDPWRDALTKIDKSIVWVPFNPTIEHLCRYLVNEVGPSVFHGTSVTLFKVEGFETDKCSAVYEISHHISEKNF
jgi:6-pyruvoyltetrahydropterin/6-carboxytetrahydropterin synthase